MASGFRSLQLDDDEPAGGVDGEEINPSPGVLPSAVLLGDYQEVVAERRDVVPQEALEIVPLVHVQRSELLDGKLGEVVVADVVEGHRFSLSIGLGAWPGQLGYSLPKPAASGPAMWLTLPSSPTA